MKRALLVLLAACGSPAVPVATNMPTPQMIAAIPPIPAQRSTLWVGSNFAPHPATAPAEPRLAKLMVACGLPDDALMVVAAETPDEVEPRLRQLGSPLVRPKVITSRDPAMDEYLRGRLDLTRTPRTRCGIAAAGDVTTIVIAEELAHLEPLFVRSRTGAWAVVDAKVLVPASSAKLVVVGPRGMPKTYPTTLDRSGRVHGSFALDRPGSFTVQLLAEVEGGPRPLLEARVFADVEPTTHDAPAPGEEATDLELMVRAVRAEEGVPRLERDPRLDALASSHVERMMNAGRVAHDLGDGDLRERFQRQGYVATVVGENVAKAATLPLAHRALYASPSHRLNLLNAQYTRFGYATVTDGPRIWVCEVFSSDLR